MLVYLKSLEFTETIDLGFVPRKGDFIRHQGIEYSVDYVEIDIDNRGSRTIIHLIDTDSYSKIRLETYLQAVRDGKEMDTPLSWHIWKRNFDIKQKNLS